MMDAVKRNELSAVQRLIANGADVNEYDVGSDNYPIIIAAWKGYTAITRALLAAGARVDVLDGGGATALHATAYAGRPDNAKLLIDAGIDVNVQGPANGYTALHDAIWQNNIEVARYIIEAGPDFSIRNHAGETALKMATSRRRSEIAQMIVEAM
jgi:ankyrin repeat protein